MNDERDSKEIDELVSGTYHELARERTPERLNQKILRMAADERKGAIGPQALFAPWMKPVAWATTIGLCLVIVLEINQVEKSTMPPVVVNDSADRLLEMTRPTPESVLERALAGKPARAALKPKPAAPLAKDEFSPSRIKAFAQTTAEKESGAPDACAATLHATREKWLNCIDTLRERGFMDEADREYAAFLLEYPAE